MGEIFLPPAHLQLLMMEMNTQQRDLAALLDNLTNLVKEWLNVVNPSINTRGHTQLAEWAEKMKSIEIPFSQPQQKEDLFENQLAALSSLELPSLEDAESALKDLQASLESVQPPEQTVSKSEEPNEPPQEEQQLDPLDLSSLKLPKNFDDFFLPEPNSPPKHAHITKRFGRTRKSKSKTPAAFDKNFFASIGASDPLPENSPPAPTDDCYGLSSLEALSASLQSFAPSTPIPPQPVKNLSYDDFFSGLNKAAETNPTSTITVAPRGDKLIREFATKEDMNRRGMQRAKKRSNVDAKGQGVYQMEDANFSSYPFATNTKIGLFCIFDGHVDKNASIAATVIFPEELETNLSTYPLTTTASDLLHHTFLSTDARMKEYEIEGTTATAVLIWEYEGSRYVQTANVGDSSAILCREGTSIMLSKDHKVNEASERQRLIDCGLDLNKGQNRINGLAVSRALGDHFIKANFAGVTAEPFLSEVYELVDDRDTMVIVASDGLWDTMSGQEAVDAVKKMKDPKTMANNLVSMATSSGLCSDNITVTVILV